MSLNWPAQTTLPVRFAKQAKDKRRFKEPWLSIEAWMGAGLLGNP